MIAPLIAAQIARDAYTKDPTWSVGAFDAVMMWYAGNPVIAIRGTTTNPETWLADAIAIPVHHHGIGWCDAGFLECALALWPKMNQGMLSACTVIGHSLGGAAAVLISALAAAERCAPPALITFGAPRAGSWKVKRLLSGIQVAMYRNGDDPVPLLPWLPFFYMHPRKLIQVGKATWNPIDDHYIEAYERALGG